MTKKLNLKKNEIITRVNYLIHFDTYQKQDYSVVSVDDSTITLCELRAWDWIGISTPFQLPLEEYNKCFYDEDEGFLSIYSSTFDAGELAIEQFIPEFQKTHPEIEFSKKRDNLQKVLRDFLKNLETVGDLCALEGLHNFLDSLRLNCFNDTRLVFIKKLANSLIELNYCKVDIEQGYMPSDFELEELYISLRRKLIEYVEKEVM